MKSYEQALNEIYSKANEQIKKRNLRQKRSMTFIASFAALGVLVISLSIGIFDREKPPMGPVDETDFGDHEGEDSVGTQTPNNNGIVVDPYSPSIYPDAWKRMNAVIVKWGEQNEQTWSESVGQGRRIEYVGVDVEFITVYSDTMYESLIPSIEETIEQTTYLMIPTYHLNEIKAGERALVFLDRIAEIIYQAPDGTHTHTRLLGVRLGVSIGEDRYVPAPIFLIENETVTVPEDAYYIAPQNDEYSMYIMSHLAKANQYISAGDTGEAVIFQRGIAVKDLETFFAYICKADDPTHLP